MDSSEFEMSTIPSIVDCLEGIVVPSIERIHRSESFLLSWAENDPFFSLHLLEIIQQQNPVFPFHVRQGACVMLRRVVDSKWIGSFIPSDIKSSIRSSILRLLIDSEPKLSTISSAIVASIAQIDYPTQWPDFVDHMMHLLDVVSDSSMRDNLLRCVGLVTEDLSDMDLGVLSGTILPIVFHYVDDHSKHVFRICRNVLQILSYVAGDGEKQSLMVNTYLKDEFLPGWIDSILRYLSERTHPDAKLEATRCLMKLLSYFGMAVSPLMEDRILPLFMHAFHTDYASYVSEAVHNHLEKIVDRDGIRVDIEAVMAQDIELLLALLENTRLSHSLMPFYESLVPYIVGCLHLTMESVEAFMTDPSEFVDDEEEEGNRLNVRASARDLLSTTCCTYGERLTEAVFAVSLEGFYASVAGGNGDGKTSNEDWIVCECALTALDVIAEFLLYEPAHASHHREIGEILNHLYPHAILNHSIPLLQGRAIQSIGSFSKLLQEHIRKEVVEAVINIASDSDQYIAVRIRALRALYKFIRRREFRIYPRMHATTLLLGLVNLAENCPRESMHVVMDSLAIVARLDDQQTSDAAEEVCNRILAMWDVYALDAMISSQIRNALVALVHVPACSEIVQHVALDSPFLSMIADETPTLSGPRNIGMEILIALAKSGVNVEWIHEKCVSTVLHVLQTSFDPQLIQSSYSFMEEIMMRVPKPSWMHLAEPILHALYRIVTEENMPQSALLSLCPFFTLFAGIFFDELKQSLRDGFNQVLLSITSRVNEGNVLFSVKKEFVVMIASLIMMDAEFVLGWMLEVHVREIVIRTWIDVQINGMNLYERMITMYVVAQLICHAWTEGISVESEVPLGSGMGMGSMRGGDHYSLPMSIPSSSSEENDSIADRVRRRRAGGQTGKTKHLFSARHALFSMMVRVLTSLAEDEITSARHRLHSGEDDDELIDPFESADDEEEDEDENENEDENDFHGSDDESEEEDQDKGGDGDDDDKASDGSNIFVSRRTLVPNPIHAIMFDETKGKGSGNEGLKDELRNWMSQWIYQMLTETTELSNALTPFQMELLETYFSLENES